MGLDNILYSINYNTNTLAIPAVAVTVTTTSDSRVTPEGEDRVRVATCIFELPLLGSVTATSRSSTITTDNRKVNTLLKRDRYHGIYMKKRKKLSI